MKMFVRIMVWLVALLALILAITVTLTWAPDRPVSELQARWAAPPSAFLDVAGMQVHLRDEGPRDDPSPIVLIHGTSASLHTWDGWADALKSKRRVIRFDLPGFGLTGPSPDGAYTTESYVRFVTAVLDKLGVQRCVLAGNSLGGNVAWETALAQPQRVEKLILVDAAGYPLRPTSVPIGFRVARIPVLNQLLRFILARSVVESSVRNVYGDPAKVTPELVDRYYELTLREGNRAALVQRLKESLATEGSAARIKALKIPTLILWGGRDRLIPPDNAARFHRDIAGSELEIFDELGHVPHEEDAGRTVAALRRFLASH
jgi:pimeloyl-ACP methyl ester carboxylesterase